MKILQRPSWLQPFIQESGELKYSTHTIRRPPIRALVLCTIAVIAIASELVLLTITRLHGWIVGQTIAWGVVSLHCLALRPRCFSFVIFVFSIALIVSHCALLIYTWQDAFEIFQRVMVGILLLCLTFLVVTVNMPMRDPRWSHSEISPAYSAPTDQLRSPEDSLTFWQWATIGWVSPLLSLARQRQLNGDDIWLLPYEFQHTLLHDTFRHMKGSVLRRILAANWIDLVILTILEITELITKYGEPLILQLLLKAMQHLRTEKRPAVTYALVILIFRVVNAQSEVFSLWYARRCYERSRGELVTMIYEKTLHRKVIGQHKDKEEDEDEPNTNLNHIDTTRSTDENTPLIGRPDQDTSSWWQRTTSQMKVLWANFRSGLKGVDPEDQGPAGLGRILNAMRYDSYEVAQRFWDYQGDLEKPFGLAISLILILRLLGWPALVGVAVILWAQVVNYLLVRVDIRLETVRRRNLDKRLQQTSQFIESIRHLRWYGWQGHWLNNVFKARRRELNMRIVTDLWVVLLIINNVFCSVSLIVAAFSAYTLLAGRPLSVDIIFPALQIFTMIEINMERIPALVQSVLKAFVALKRIQTFMDEPDKGEIENKITSESAIQLEGASFAWPGLEECVLHNLNVKFDTGLTVVTGEVASGKSALLQGVLGELDLREGRLLKSAKPIAYCAQTPWLQSMTIRDNILFNAPLQSDRYQKTLQACALMPDLASFEKGDLSPIGENGIGLSGGQKARVALARAIYSDAPIVLLDDPLSALDQQTSEHIVRDCLCGELTRGRTLVLVTHRTDLCGPVADQIYKVHLGRLEVKASGEGLSTDNQLSLSKTNDTTDEKASDEDLLKNAMPDKFEDDEFRAHGEIKARVYWQYFKSGTFTAWGFVLVMITLERMMDIIERWFLKEFGEGFREADSIYTYANQTSLHAKLIPHLRNFFDLLPSPRTDVKPWLVGILILGVIQTFFILASQLTILIARYLAGKNLFRAVMDKLANTTFRYYDVTPSGLLLNRLTSDIGQIDGGIADDLYWMLLDAAYWVVSLLAIAFVTPLFLVVSILLTGMYLLTFFYFLPASQSLRRLETVSLSPLMTNFGALLTGLTTVRAFKAEDRFQASLIKVVDTFQGMDHFYWSVQSWLAYRLEILSAVSTFVLTGIAIWTELSAGLTAFVLVTAQSFVQSTHDLCRAYGKIQVNFVSVERVVELLDVDQEPTNSVRPPAWWPSYGGSIVFENVTLRYAPQFDPALTDVSFEIKGGTNTAIVGRTGSGKSTLAAALLATVPIEKGRILIDGVDLATVDRQALRTRVTFLAQEPVLFEGTLRHNLDPTNEHSDEDCKSVVDRVAEKFGWTLTTSIEPGGKNLSQGQRQLIGLARAILRRSSIIIMDEATASIDVETAWEIQRVLREELKGSTVITIAHRTAAVRDADNAIVLAKGKLVSFGPANDTAENEVDDAGETFD